MVKMATSSLEYMKAQEDLLISSCAGAWVHLPNVMLQRHCETLRTAVFIGVFRDMSKGSHPGPSVYSKTHYNF